MPREVTAYRILFYIAFYVGRGPDIFMSLAYADWQFMKQRGIPHEGISLYKDGVWSRLP